MKAIRRQFPQAWAALGATLLIGVLAGCAPAAPRVATLTEGVTQVDLGGVKVSMLSDGFVSRPLDANFVRNAPLGEVQAALKEAGLPTDKLDVPYTPLLVDIRGQRVLFDAGNGEFGAPGTGRMLERMNKAGIDPKSVTAVVVSHFHGDHINGLRNKAGEFLFPNAKVYVPAPEWNWWMDDARMAATAEASRGGFNTARRVFAPIAGSVQRFAPGSEVLPGVRSIAAYGHTPGHTAFVIEGSQRKLLFWGDATNVAALFVRNPDWAVMFDMNAEAARVTRRQLADMAIRDKLLIAGYHLPGSAIGTLSTRGKGYEFTPLR